MPVPHALIIALLPLPLLAHATQQFPDTLEVDGKPRAILSQPWPLAPFFAIAENRQRLQALLPRHRCTASLRGYTARWYVEGERLLLRQLSLAPCNPAANQQAPLEPLFPAHPQPVAAQWFTGRITVRLDTPAPQAPAGARYLILNVENGRIVGREETERPAQ